MGSPTKSPTQCFCEIQEIVNITSKNGGTPFFEIQQKLGRYNIMYVPNFKRISAIFIYIPTPTHVLCRNPVYLYLLLNINFDV